MLGFRTGEVSVQSTPCFGTRAVRCELSPPPPFGALAAMGMVTRGKPAPRSVASAGSLSHRRNLVAKLLRLFSVIYRSPRVAHLFT